MSEFDGTIELDDEERELLEDAAEMLEDAGYDVTMYLETGGFRGEHDELGERISVNVNRKGSWSISHTEATEGGGGPEGVLERVEELIEYHSQK